MQPIERQTEGTTALAPEEALSRAEATLTARRGRVTVTEDGLGARGGSRIALRLWGVYLPWGRRNLPWRVELQLRPAGAGTTHVTIRAFSDEGFGLARVPKLTRAYEELLTDLVADTATVLRGQS